MSEITPTPMSMCPMAETCKQMMRRRFSGFGLVVPGVIFMALGVLIVIEPRIIAWVVAVAFIVLGAFMLMFAIFIRKIGKGH